MSSQARDKVPTGETFRRNGVRCRDGHLRNRDLTKKVRSLEINCSSESEWSEALPKKTANFGRATA